jgi:hypothetical protein
MNETMAHKAAFAMQPIDQIRSLRVRFDNRPDVIGPVSSWGAGGFAPDVTVLNSMAKRHEDPAVRLDWPHVTSIEVEFMDGTVKTVP